MRVFIQSTPIGVPKSHNFFIADQGFKEMGFETIPFSTMEDLAQCRPDDLIVGGLGSVTGKLKEYGITVPNINYPDELKPYLGRRIWETTIDQVLNDESIRPVFVKPIREKRFTGVVLRSEKDFPKMSYCDPQEPVLCSEVIDFETEWRVFVRYGKILDVRPYYGTWKNHFDTRVIENAVNAYFTAPAGYAIDFGYTAEGKTLLVEVNDGFSVGSYGLAALDYAKLLSARWCELVGIHDECDTMYDGYEWKKKKKEVAIGGCENSLHSL